MNIYDILNSSFLHFSISTYFSIILTVCFPIQISKTEKKHSKLCSVFASHVLSQY